MSLTTAPSVSVTPDSSTQFLTASRGGHATKRVLLGLVVSVVVTGAVALAMPSHASVSKQPTSTYGSIPSWIPVATLPSAAPLAVSAEHPGLGIGGDSMMVSLAHAKVLVTMTGPTVPPFVAPPPPLTTITVTLKFTALQGSVQLNSRDIGLIDGNGVVLRPQSFVGGATNLWVSAGHPQVVQVRAFMAIGSGSIGWAPNSKIVATWEFTVEND